MSKRGCRIVVRPGNEAFGRCRCRRSRPPKRRVAPRRHAWWSSDMKPHAISSFEVVTAVGRSGNAKPAACGTGAGSKREIALEEPVAPDRQDPRLQRPLDPRRRSCVSTLSSWAEDMADLGDARARRDARRQATAPPSLSNRIEGSLVPSLHSQAKTTGGRVRLAAGEEAICQRAVQHEMPSARLLCR